MEQRSKEWHEARKGRITASRVGAILGNNPYKDRADVMREMVREAIGEPPEFVGNIATQWGMNNEAGVLIDYRLETQHDVAEVGFIEFEDWAGVSPDGLIGDSGLVEIKAPYSLRDAEAPVPFKPLSEYPHYNDQMQFQLYVTARKWCHWFQWAPNGTELLVVKPDEDWQNENLPRLRQFHAEFLHEVENNADEYRKPKRAVIDTPEAAKMMAEWDNINDQLALLGERKKDMLDSIVSMAGEKDTLFAGRKLTMVEREGAVAWARIVKEHLPKLDLAKYRGKSSRYWRVG